MNIIHWIRTLLTFGIVWADDPGAGGAPAPTPGGPAPAPEGGATPPAEPAKGNTPPTGDGLSLEAPAPSADPTPADTGDPALDLALDYFVSKGIKLDDPALERAANGDFALLEAKLAVLGDKAKGGDKYLALVKNAYTAQKSAAEAKMAATKDAVVKVVGDEATWNAVRDWAAANASEAERVEITAGLKQGGVVAKAIAKYLHGAYQQANGRPPASAVKPDATGRAPVGAPMTARAYSDAVAQLAMKLGGAMEGSQEYAQLRAQRSSARAAGY